MRALAVLAVLVPVGTRADSKLPTTPSEVFASGMRIDASVIVDVQDFQLRDGGEYRRAIVGRFKSGELVIGGAVLVWCDAKLCWSTHAWLGPGEIETLGLVDLGAPGAFPTSAKSKYERELKLGSKPKWPALLVRTTRRENTTTQSRYGGSKTGEHRTTELAVLSLSRKDEKFPAVLTTLVDEHWPTGAGVHVTFEVGKDGHIIATEQRDLESVSACLRPKPTTVHYKLDEHRRFRRASDLEHHGCGSR